MYRVFELRSHLYDEIALVPDEVSRLAEQSRGKWRVVAAHPNYPHSRWTLAGFEYKREITVHLTQLRTTTSMVLVSAHADKPIEIRQAESDTDWLNQNLTELFDDGWQHDTRKWIANVAKDQVEDVLIMFKEFKPQRQLVQDEPMPTSWEGTASLKGRGIVGIYEIE